MRILVTGGAGYIGSVLVPDLLSSGYSVTVLDNLMFRQSVLTECSQSERFSFVRGDVRDLRLITELVKTHDAIIPLAALVGAPLCDRDPDSALAVNQTAIFQLCDLLSEDQHVLMPMTNSGYGIGEKNVHCDEESPLRPVSLYGRTKVEAEKRVLQRTNSMTFRFATIFGMAPRMRLDLMVNDFCYRAYRDRAILIFEGHFRRNFLHIRDASRVFLHGLKNFQEMRGRCYNVGLEEANLTKLELCQRIAQHFPGFVYVEAPVGQDPDKRDYWVSNRRILGTGFTTEWGLDRGLAELRRGLPLLSPGPYSNV